MGQSEALVGPTFEAAEAARIAAGYFTIEEAARDIGEVHGWSKQQVATLREQMMRATGDGALTVRHPHTDLPYRPEVARDFYELVTRDDVNAWLVSIRAPYRWVPYEQAALEPRYIAGRRLWKLRDAIETIAAMPGFGVPADALMVRVQRDAEQRKLTLRDLEHGAEIKSDWGAIVLGWRLYAEDFNAWLEAAGYPEPYRLRDDMAPDFAAPADSDCAPLMPAGEVAEHRRARLLEWFEEEVKAKGKRGAVARVFAREKAQRPTADRANVGTDIRKARAARDKQRKGGGGAIGPPAVRALNLPGTTPKHIAAQL